MPTIQELTRTAENLALKNCWGEEAVIVNRQIIEQDEGKNAAYTRLARCFETQRKYKSAYKIYNKVVKLNPDNNIAKNGLKRLKARQAEYNIKEIDNFEELCILGISAKHDGNDSIAIVYFQKALKFKPTEVLLASLGGSYRKLNQLKSAEKMYIKAITDYNSFIAKTGLAAVYCDQGNFLESLKLYKEVLSEKPNDTYALNGIVSIYLKTGGFESINLDPFSLKHLREIVKTELAKTNV